MGNRQRNRFYSFAIAIVWGSGSRDLWKTGRVQVPGTAAKFENERQALYNCRDETCVRRCVQPSPEASPVENIRSRCSDCCVGRSRDLHEPGRIPQSSGFGGSGRDRFRSRSYAVPPAAGLDRLWAGPVVAKCAGNYLGAGSGLCGRSPSEPVTDSGNSTGCGPLFRDQWRRCPCRHTQTTHLSSGARLRFLACNPGPDLRTRNFPE